MTTEDQQSVRVNAMEVCMSCLCFWVCIAGLIAFNVWVISTMAHLGAYHLTTTSTELNAQRNASLHECILQVRNISGVLDLI